MYGPGVENGVLASYQSRFICDTRGAGAGQLTVRIRGPKGKSRVCLNARKKEEKYAMISELNYRIYNEENKSRKVRCKSA